MFTYFILLPEAILLSFVLLSIFVGLFSKSQNAQSKATKTIQLGLLLAFLALFYVDYSYLTPVSFKGYFVLDVMALFSKKIILIGAFVCTIFGVDWLKYKNYSRFEYPILVAFSVLGMMITVSANNFLIQFLGLELMSYPLLFLTAYKRQGERSTEAGVKYVFVTFLNTGLYLFGVSMLFLIAGTLSFPEIASQDVLEIKPLMLFASCFIYVGLFLKIGVVPFHTWIANVYEGVPSCVTALFAVVVRVPVFIALARVMLFAMPSLNSFWYWTLMFLSIVCVCVGGLKAIVQTNIKRLVACSVVVFNGYALIALVVQSPSLLLLFLATETLLFAGLMAIVLCLRVGGNLSEDIRILSGLGKQNPILAAIFTLIFLGLTGLPPFAGFWGRFLVFMEIARPELILYAIFITLSGMLLMYAYLKIIRQMYMVQAKDELIALSLRMKIIITLCAFLSSSLILFVYSLSQWVKIG